MALRSPGNKWLFYYDGDCGFCRKVVRWLSLMDFFGRVSWVPYQNEEKLPAGLSVDDLDRSVYLSDGGRLYEGFYAFRTLTLKLLPLLLFAPLFWCPGVDTIGNQIYRWVAGNRHRISMCRVTGTPLRPRRRDLSNVKD
jgi:predicted DCC family thiol-disulfide oxidoreductase YuxK